MNIRNEIKAQIVRAGYTMQKVTAITIIFLGPAPTILNATKIVVGKDSTNEMIGKISPSFILFLHSQTCKITNSAMTSNDTNSTNNTLNINNHSFQGVGRPRVFLYSAISSLAVSKSIFSFTAKRFTIAI